ncbi:hypothetical protein GCM10017581_055310 [Dactylosporangium matsuzakiense]|uniref:Uncharacterized protein n=1 Tax=Dactylosporangium matsuzakiense TaxID=53360 RepID=A0A9W6KP80_9ACTN|nr:hypothetical protein GCM10017581_055310 [Dactylosporangium matsuzakiense]
MFAVKPPDHALVVYATWQPLAALAAVARLTAATPAVRTIPAIAATWTRVRRVQLLVPDMGCFFLRSRQEIWHSGRNADVPHEQYVSITFTIASQSVDRLMSR